MLASESLRKEPLFGMESKGSGVTDPPDFDVSGGIREERAFLEEDEMTVPIGKRVFRRRAPRAAECRCRCCGSV